MRCVTDRQQPAASSVPTACVLDGDIGDRPHDLNRSNPVWENAETAPAAVGAPPAERFRCLPTIRRYENGAGAAAVCTRLDRCPSRAGRCVRTDCGGGGVRERRLRHRTRRRRHREHAGWLDVGTRAGPGLWIRAAGPGAAVGTVSAQPAVPPRRPRPAAAADRAGRAGAAARCLAMAHRPAASAGQLEATPRHATAGPGFVPCRRRSDVVVVSTVGRGRGRGRERGQRAGCAEAADRGATRGRGGAGPSARHRRADRAAAPGGDAGGSADRRRRRLRRSCRHPARDRGAGRHAADAHHGGPAGCRTVEAGFAPTGDAFAHAAVDPGRAGRRIVQLHRVARPACADPGGRGIHQDRQGRLRPPARPGRQRPPRPGAGCCGAHEQHDRRAAVVVPAVGQAGLSDSR